MKIAICFSGQIRTGIHAYNSIRNFIGDLWDSCDFFCHTWDAENIAHGEYIDNPHANGFWQLMDDRIFDVMHKIPNQKIDNFNNLYPFKKFVVSEMKPHTLHPLYYSMYLSNEYKREYELNNNFKYDVVIKMRPDIIFHPTHRLQDSLDKFDTDYCYNFMFALYKSDFLETYKKMEDIFFMASSDNMDLICSIADTIDFSNNFEDRQVIHFNYIRDKGIPIKFCNNYYYTLLRYFYLCLPSELDIIDYFYTKVHNDTIYL